MATQYTIYVNFASNGVHCLQIFDALQDGNPGSSGSNLEGGTAERKRVGANETVQWISVVETNQLTITFPNGAPFAVPQLLGNGTNQVTSGAANGTDKTRHKYVIELLNPNTGRKESEDPQIIIDNTALGGKGRKRPAKKEKR